MDRAARTRTPRRSGSVMRSLVRKTLYFAVAAVSGLLLGGCTLAIAVMLLRVAGFHGADAGRADQLGLGLSMISTACVLYVCERVRRFVTRPDVVAAIETPSEDGAETLRAPMAAQPHKS